MQPFLSKHWFQLEKGIPGDPRFPERDNEWIANRAKDNDLLVQWLEDFKSKYAQYDEAKATIDECEEVLELYNKVVNAAKIPLEIQNARNAKSLNGSCLQYGLEYHLQNFKGPVSIFFSYPSNLSANGSLVGERNPREPTVSREGQ